MMGMAPRGVISTEEAYHRRLRFLSAPRSRIGAASNHLARRLSAAMHHTVDGAGEGAEKSRLPNIVAASRNIMKLSIGIVAPIG